MFFYIDHWFSCLALKFKFWDARTEWLVCLWLHCDSRASGNLRKVKECISLCDNLKYSCLAFVIFFICTAWDKRLFNLFIYWFIRLNWYERKFWLWYFSPCYSPFRLPITVAMTTLRQRKPTAFSTPLRPSPIHCRIGARMNTSAN